MSTIDIATLRRSTVFLAVNALVLAAIYLIAVEPAITTVQDRYQFIEQKAQTFVRMASMVERRQMIDDVARDSDELLRQSFVQGDTLTMLNADLLAQLRRSADRYQIAFNSVASLPQRKWLSQMMVSARVEFVASSLRTSAFLNEIETALPFLFIHSAKLTALPKQDGGEEIVTVALEVYGATRWQDN